VKVVVVGSGGREHALVRALLRSPQRPEVLCAPGNAGIRADAVPLDADPSDVEGFAQAAAEAGIDLVVVGPEVPLVAGLVDSLEDAGVRAFGPRRAVAALEGSKAFAKSVMRAAGVPTGDFAVVDDVETGLAAIREYPIVLKADGLAAGKGVVIAGDEMEAGEALEAMLVERRFGDGPVLVEQHLVGREVSLLALCDGERAVALAPARDYKRIGDGDAGPNTGGMGCFSPVDLPEGFVEETIAAVHQPVVNEFARAGTPFHGVLYAGLMLTDAGLKVLEFNVRFGDPETQVVLPRLRSDLLELLDRCTRLGGLAGAGELEWDPRAAVTVVLASRGYPASSSSGDVIHGLDAAAQGAEVVHAGTAERDGDIVTAGGRVLNVTALGEDRSSARSAAYAAADMIAFDGLQLRRDIGV